VLRYPALFIKLIIGNPRGLENDIIVIKVICKAPQFEVVITRKENATVVSNIAIVHEGDLSYVVLDKGNGQYERRNIKIGLETADKTEILSGLKGGTLLFSSKP